MPALIKGIFDTHRLFINSPGSMHPAFYNMKKEEFNGCLQNVFAGLYYYPAALSYIVNPTIRQMERY